MSEPINEQNPADMINVESGVSIYTGEPFIKISWGDMHGQLTPEAARAHALYILECADAAISDAFLWHFLRERAGIPEEKAAQALMLFREYREGKQPPAEIPDEEK